jgi:hypothetical protein
MKRDEQAFFSMSKCSHYDVFLVLFQETPDCIKTPLASWVRHLAGGPLCPDYKQRHDVNWVLMPPGVSWKITVFF